MRDGMLVPTNGDVGWYLDGTWQADWRSAITGLRSSLTDTRVLLLDQLRNLPVAVAVGDLPAHKGRLHIASIPPALHPAEVPPPSIYYQWS